MQRSKSAEVTKSQEICGKCGAHEALRSAEDGAIWRAKRPGNLSVESIDNKSIQYYNDQFQQACSDIKAIVRQLLYEKDVSDEHSGRPILSAAGKFKVHAVGIDAKDAL